MSLSLGKMRIVAVAVLAGGVLLCGNPSGAQTSALKPDVAGEYECTEARVAGKSVPCTVGSFR
jgi:hypothetical protein